MGGKGHGGGVDNEQGEVGLVILEVGPVESRLSIPQDFFNFGEEGDSGTACSITFSEDMPDIVPLPIGAGSAVAGDRVNTSVSTLFSQHPVCHVVLAQHLDVDP